MNKPRIFVPRAVVPEAVELLRTRCHVHVGPEGLSVACADCWYVLSTARPQGKKDMSARDLLNGILRGLPKGICGVARAPATGE